MDLYVFDKRLRLLFLDALERVEIALRVHIALLLGARDPWAHRNPDQLHPRFTQSADPITGEIEYPKWIRELDREFARSKDEFAKHFKQKYAGEHPPIWIAIELWNFGMLSKFLSGMKYADQELLAAKYRLPRPELLTSWVRNLNHIRNICAHHSRLWNRSPSDQIRPPRLGEHAMLDHLANDQRALSRIYASAAAIQFLLQTIHPSSSWAQRLKSHCRSFPKSGVINLSHAGFPVLWEQLSLWGETR